MNTLFEYFAISMFIGMGFTFGAITVIAVFAVLTR